MRITDAGIGATVTVRISGGIGVAVSARSAGTLTPVRPYVDVDCASRRRQRRRGVDSLLCSLGYEPDTAFDALQGHPQSRERAATRTTRGAND
jgi:hypothetical protein